MIKKLFLLMGVSIILAQFSLVTFAAEPIFDSVIRDFKSTIQVRDDASLVINEDLVVDSGNLPDKHGIFRSLPTKANREEGEFDRTPISLKSITDFEPFPRGYETIHDKANNVITWKIGYPNRTITGINNYRINYEVQNAVTKTDDGMELYWNLNGNFWELPINNYQADIFFPPGISAENTSVQLFTGKFGAKNQDATFEWTNDSQLRFNTLTVISTRELMEGEGITIKVQMPAGIITPYQPSWWDLYGGYLPWLWLIPILWVIWLIGREMAKDENKKGPVTVQYEPPNKMLPLELGVFETRGMAMPGKYVSATIIHLAVKGFIKIEETETKSMFRKTKGWKLVLLKNDFAGLAKFEQTILHELFDGNFEIGNATTLADHQNKFYKVLTPIKKFVMNKFKDQGLFKSGSAFFTKGLIMGIVGFFMFIISPRLADISIENISLGFILISILVVITIWYFAVKFSPKKSREGAEVDYHLKGFKLYLRQAEKYRMEFYEKENIFEKYLPHAIAFGLVGKWVEAFKKIYGEEKANAYIPIWYVGHIHAVGGIDNFASSISSVSSKIGSSLSSTPGGSGSGGGGFSGGGGGGGGGGSW